MTVTIQVRRLPHGAGLPLPAYATAGAAGMDLLAASRRRSSSIPASARLIPTGLAIALPPGFELQVRPRSGLALRNGIVLPNSPGTIDEDYRGEVQVIVLNAGDARVHRRARHADRAGDRCTGGSGGVAGGAIAWTTRRGAPAGLAARERTPDGDLRPVKTLGDRGPPASGRLCRVQSVVNLPFLRYGSVGCEMGDC